MKIYKTEKTEYRLYDLILLIVKKRDEGQNAAQIASYIDMNFDFEAS